MTKAELILLQNSAADSLELEKGPNQARTDNPEHRVMGSRGWFPLTSFRRPIRSNGELTVYMNVLKAIRDNGGSIQTKDAACDVHTWQQLRYSGFLEKEKRGVYHLSWLGEEYIDKMLAIKDLYDLEQKYINEGGQL